MYSQQNEANMEATENQESGRDLQMENRDDNGGKRRDYRLAGCTLVFGEYGVLPTQCRGLRGVCLTGDTSGNIVVADTINDRLQIIDPENFQLVRCIAVERPFDVCCMGDCLFVTQPQLHRISVLKDDGRILRIIESDDTERLNHPTGITRDRTKDLLYVSDSGNRCVRLITSSGSFMRTFGRQSFARCAPWYITLGQNRIYISDSKKAVHIFNAEATSKLGTISAGSSQDEMEVKPIRVGVPPRRLRATGITTDAKGNLIVCDASGRLIVIGEDGCVLSTIATSGEGQGQLCVPQGVVVNSEGDIIVCDDGNCRLVKYEVPWI